ncbi:alpha-ketoglutarate-dependent dioxygenase AlkB [Nocardioides mesophilus]|uniref:Alpha-ketoglutarate-dependent dioxygenase AlkB n=1 Tax=Nocardioides mesophilus TaxID=433659 RepID=A0A7G9RDZ3_9ACTN|nr:alpha-ketoglutarate-dependent dioxygenase AlkB [Nocardioides mesophilus]QNN53818.1 alpha-ketoglutarate-dependent dioxygenase AlkB [Nocardioides mesophilus]
MSVDFQASLFDDLLGEPAAPVGGAPAGFGDLAAGLLRHRLGAGAWVDVRPGWVRGADELFARLVREVPWRAERRQMYDRVVDVPRLLKFYDAHEPLPDPVLAQARERLSAHYAEELGEPFTTAGLCYYRDGRDSVTWHGDRIGRSNRHDTMVAIVSLGDARRLSLRPRPGHATGEPVSFLVGHGDLLVMGGSCQRTWEHAVLKSTRPVGPRVSIQFRPHNVR